MIKIKIDNLKLGSVIKHRPELVEGWEKDGKEVKVRLFEHNTSCSIGHSSKVISGKIKSWKIEDEVLTLSF